MKLLPYKLWFMERKCKRKIVGAFVCTFVYLCMLLPERLFRLIKFDLIVS